MAKKVSDSQVAGIKAHAEAKNKETIILSNILYPVNQYLDLYSVEL